MGTEQKNKMVNFLAKFKFHGKSISLFTYCTNQLKPHGLGPVLCRVPELLLAPPSKDDFSKESRY